MANETNSICMKLQVPARLLEEIDPILIAQDMSLDRTLCLFMQTVAQTNSLLSVVSNVGNSALVGGARKEIPLYLPAEVQSKAQAVFTALGLSQSTAAAMFLKAVIDTKTLPFSAE